jgi:hypothetical protein
MHPHRTVPWPEPIAAPGSRRFDDQRLLLLELVVDPPADGEPIDLLAARLGRSRAAIVAAGKVLQRAGLAEIGAGGLRASAPAWAFEALWPVRP